MCIYTRVKGGSGEGPSALIHLVRGAIIIGDRAKIRAFSSRFVSLPRRIDNVLQPNRSDPILPHLFPFFRSRAYSPMMIVDAATSS